MFEHVVRRISECERSPRIHRCDVARDTLMGMVAAGDGNTLTSEATAYVPFSRRCFPTDRGRNRTGAVQRRMVATQSQSGIAEPA